MQEVSNAWKEAHKQMLLPETFVEITLSVSDSGAANVATVTGTNGASFSNPGVIVNSMADAPTTKYALLEHNLWTLDGTKNVMPSLSTYKAPGYVSNTATLETITISLSAPRTVEIPGFTITWSGEHEDYATDFTVTVKKSGTTVVSKTVTGNKSNVSNIEMPCSNYDEVVITVSGWSLPDRRMRVDSVVFGYLLVFDKNQLISYSHDQTGDPISTELSKNSIDFSVDNSDGRWNLLNPTGFEKYLSERQRITVRYGMDINGATEWIRGGTFYLTEWKSNPNGLEASFSARDALEFMLDVPYESDGITATVTGSAAKVYGTVYDDTSAIKDLSQNSKITITAAVTGSDYHVISDGFVYSTDIDYTQPTLEERFSEALAEAELPTDLVIDSDIPWCYAQWVVEPTTVANYVQMCANASGCSIWQTRDGVLKIWPLSQKLSDYVIGSQISYSHPEVELTKPLKKVELKVSYAEVDNHGSEVKPMSLAVNCSTSGENLIVENPQMSLGAINKLDLLRWYRNAWRCREVVSGEFRADPRLDLFDIVSVETQYGTISPVMITSIKYTYNGGFRGTYTGRRIVLDNGNLVSSSENMTDMEVYNGTGYKNGAYVSDNSDGTDPSCVATGWIVYKWRKEYPLYIKGAAITTDSHVRFYGYNTKTSAPKIYVTGSNLSTYFAKETLGTNYYKLTPKSNITSVGYIRISLIGTGENLVIT